MDIFRVLIAVYIENVQEIWPTKMDFGRPNAEIGWKMANGWLLFLVLYVWIYMPNDMHMIAFVISCLIHFS